MKIVTWNINGVRARIGNLTHWLSESAPDIVCLQEMKIASTSSSRAPRSRRSAIMSRRTARRASTASPSCPSCASTRSAAACRATDTDEQARFIEGVFSTPSGALRVASLYLPNGNPIGTDKFVYKLAWMERLERWAADRLALEEPLVLAGDYNVIPEPIDARNPEAWVTDALFQPESRQAFRRLAHLGFTDAIRAVSDADGIYTFWDYQAGAWQKNNGIRIDHLMLSPEAADRLRSASVEKHVRAWEKPSDHVPTAVVLSL